MASPYSLTNGVNGRGGSGYGDHTHVIGYESSRYATERYGTVTMEEGAMAVTLAFTNVVNATYLDIQGGSDFIPYIGFSTSATGYGSSTSNKCPDSCGKSIASLSTSYTSNQITLGTMVTPGTAYYLFASRNDATYGWRYWMNRVTITVNIPAGCVWIYSGGWKRAIPYVYSGGWKQAIPYIYNSGWKVCG